MGSVFGRARALGSVSKVLNHVDLWCVLRYLYLITCVLLEIFISLLQRLSEQDSGNVYRQLSEGETCRR